MKRVAIPLVEHRLSEYFGQCSYYEIFEIDHKTIKSSKVGKPAYKSSDSMPDWINEKGITDVIIHKIDKKVFSMLADTKINLFVGIPIDTPDSIIQGYLSGNLKSDTKIINEIIG
jgi:predicted Fe-Mo cluster-binding NifX family protein